MPEYRIYLLSTPEKIEGPALSIVCNSNEEAVSRAAEYLRKDNYVEIWQGARMVRRLRRPPQSAPSS